MSFKQYVKEQEELLMLSQETSKREQIADLIRTMEDINNEKLRDFAISELGMSEEEAEALVYKMLRDYLLASDKEETIVPDEDDLGSIDAIDIGGEDDFEDDMGDMDMGNIDADVDADVEDDVDADVEDDVEDDVDEE